jgi:hypothetical protein
MLSNQDVTGEAGSNQNQQERDLYNKAKPKSAISKTDPQNSDEEEGDNEKYVIQRIRKTKTVANRGN